MAIDHECSCNKNPLLPSLCRVIDVKQETPDVQTYTIQTLDGKKPFFLVLTKTLYDWNQLSLLGMVCK